MDSGRGGAVSRVRVFVAGICAALLWSTDTVESGSGSSVNWALGRPCFQSSREENAARAVDGNLGAVFTSGTCTHTAPAEDGPWWAVELVAEVNVERVVIVNRAECCASRLHDFNVGLTDTSPSVLAPRSPAVYLLCGHHAGAAGAGEHVNVECDADHRLQHSGTYVVVNIPLPAQTLTLCEVQVYGEVFNMTRDNPVRAVVGRKMGAGRAVGEEYTASRAQCLAACTHSDQCGSFNYKSAGRGKRGTCQLNHVLWRYTDDDLENTAEWSWYKVLHGQRLV